MKITNKDIFYDPGFIFIMLWVLVTLFLLLLPIESRFSSLLNITLVNMTFVLIASLSSILGRRIPKIKLFSNKKLLSKQKLHFIINFSVICSILGLCFVIYDRIFVRGIDYSLGLRNARYQWLSLGDIGSIWSKIGNLMIPFCYCALFLSIFHWERLPKIKRLIGFFVGLGTQVTLSILNGGRSNILIAVMFVFVTCIIRKAQGKNFLPIFNLKTIIVLGIIAVFLLKYCISILYTFSDNNVTYLSKAAYSLGADISLEYIKNPNMVINTITHIFLYLFHGSFYTGAVLENMPFTVSIDQNISLRGLWSILDKLHLIDYDLQLPPFDSGSGAFIAVPGIFLYDYGYVGFVLASILVGIFLGLTVKVIRQRKSNLGIIGLVFSITVLIHVFLSPVTMALGLGYFPFMIFAMIAMEIIAGFVYGFSGWTQVPEVTGQ